MEIINKIYKTVGKCYYQQQYKAIIEAKMVSTPNGCTKNIPMKHNQYDTTLKTSTRKSLRKTSEALDVKHKNDVCR